METPRLAMRMGAVHVDEADQRDMHMIRLEDDVLIQESGAPINLMQKIPIELEEIEDLMNRGAH